MVGLGLIALNMSLAVGGKFPKPLRFVCSHLQNAPDYSCDIEIKTEESITFVLTRNLAINAEQLNIFGWRENFALIVEQ